MDPTIRPLSAHIQTATHVNNSLWRFRAFLMILAIAFGLPIAAGLVGTLLPAFGYLPAVGGRSLSLEPWRELVGYPGFTSALRLTLTTGFVATGSALILGAGFCATVHGRIRLGAAEAMLAPLLAAPHSAIAIGLAFVLAPSGWLVRLATPWLTGWSTPPDVASVGDAYGIALVVGLLVKEVPYLLLVILGALNQIPVESHVRAARALGYGRGVAWLKIIFPQVYAQIRLPVYVVLAYSLSVVDMALILGPGNPSTLSVLALRWFTAADVALYLPAAAAATLQFIIMAIAISLWRLGERASTALGRRWIRRGGRGLPSEPGLKAASVIVIIIFALGCAALLAMALWSIAWSWRFPDALPTQFTLGNWSQLTRGLAWPLANTLKLALLTSTIGLAAAIAWFEGDDRHGRTLTPAAMRFVYIPLLAPQIAFMFGVQAPLVWLGLDGTVSAVAWAHLLFVFPYMLLALADPWRALDPRFARSAASLGASPKRILFAVKLPMLLGPILIAFAIGFAVSFAQYVPTLFAGAGRTPTLTTEAITLASGGDRRVVGVYAFLQSILPFLVYSAALAAPALVYRDRKAMLGRA